VRIENFSGLRTSLKACTPPCVPYLGLFLSDLTFIEAGNSNFLSVSARGRNSGSDADDGGGCVANASSSPAVSSSSASASAPLINFRKSTQVADVILGVLYYQNPPYCLRSVPEIQEFLEDQQPSVNEESLFQDSLLCEPKQTSSSSSGALSSSVSPCTSTDE
jgi:RasGEF domain